MAFKLLLCELRYRLAGSVATLAAVVVAAGLFVAGPTLLANYGDKSRAEAEAGREKLEATLRKHDNFTRQAMLRLGFNVRIVHRDTDISAMLSDYAAAEMPEEYVQRLAQSPKVTKIAHITGTLLHPISLDNRKRMLIGFAPEAQQQGAGGKKPIILAVAPGTAILGHEAGRSRAAGETVEILGRSFRIAKILEMRDSHDDLMVALNLADAQAVLGKPGRINAILAISCNCETGDRIGEVAEQVNEVLPDVQVTESGTLAGVRSEQRAAAKRLLEGELASAAGARQREEDRLATLVGVTTPLVVLAAAVWIGMLAWTNTSHRREEIGLLRALGKSGGWIAGLFLGKAALIGLAGGAIGAAAGLGVARWWAEREFSIPPGDFAYASEILLWAIGGAPCVAALAAYLPTLRAVLQDPASVLRDA